jgi:hypothetical protein
MNAFEGIDVMRDGLAHALGGYSWSELKNLRDSIDAYLAAMMENGNQIPVCQISENDAPLRPSQEGNHCAQN